MNIIFTDTATPISDFEVEDKYLEIKEKPEVEISNIILLQRIRVGIIEKEIEPSSLIVKEKGNTVLSTTIDKLANVESWDTEILNLESKFISIIWENIKNSKKKEN